MVANLKKIKGAVYLGTMHLELVLADLCLASFCVLITLAVLASRGKIGGGEIAIALCSVLTVVALSICVVLMWHRDVTSNKLNDLLSLSNEERRERNPNNSGVVATLVSAAIGISLVIVAILAEEGKIKGGVPVVISCLILPVLIHAIICLVVSIFTSGARCASDIMGLDNRQTNQDEPEPPLPTYSKVPLPEHQAEGVWYVEHNSEPNGPLSVDVGTAQASERHVSSTKPKTLPTYQKDWERLSRGGGSTMQEAN